MSRRLLLPLAGMLLIVLAATPLAAGQRYALVISGAAGGSPFAERYEEWRTRLAAALSGKLGFVSDNVVALGEKGGAKVGVASAANIRSALAALAVRMRAGDVLLVVLIGHGALDGDSAKFNIVGPDLDAAQWSAALRGIPGRVVFVNTTSASFPFLTALAAKGRVVITATDSRAGRYDTVFAEYFIKALETAAADADKNQRLSVWEVFSAAAAGVRRYYEQKGLLPVEHAVLDDEGDGFGKDSEQPGVDATTAKSLYLTADPVENAADAQTRELLARRDGLLDEIEKLKKKKSSMEAGEYEAQLEKLLVDLAKVSRELRARGTPP